MIGVDSMSQVIINQDTICLKTDREIIRQALLAKCRSLERLFERGNLKTNERKRLQDEYERTFALTQEYRR